MNDIGVLFTVLIAWSSSFALLYGLYFTEFGHQLRLSKLERLTIKVMKERKKRVPHFGKGEFSDKYK